MPNYQSLVVTVGRNVGNEPLGFDRWHDYQQAIRLALAEIPDSFFTVDGNTGVGFWNDVVEDNCVFVVLVPAPTTAEEAQASSNTGRLLSCALAHAAFDFGQEAVAVTGGLSYLVPAHEDGIRVIAREGDDEITAFLAAQAEEGHNEGDV